MPSTPIYGLPYPSLSDPPNGPAQIQALADAVEDELDRIDDTIDVDQSLLTGFAAPTQTGSGTLASSAQATIMSVSISDPGFSYHIIAFGTLDWAMNASNQAGNLMYASITVDSTDYNTNVLCRGYGISLGGLGAQGTQPTIPTGMRRSDTGGPYTGAHTVRLIARNGAPSATAFIPSSSPVTSLFVRIVRV